MVGGSGTGVSPHNSAVVLHILAWLPGQCIATHRPLEPSPLRTAGEDTPGGDGDGDDDTGCGGDAAPVMRIDESMEPTNHCRRQAET